MSIGIVAALYQELEPLLQMLGSAPNQSIPEGHCQSIRFNGEELLFARCGVGKVNAAMCAQRLIDRYEVEAILNIGAAAAVNERLKIGDLVVSQSLIQHDFDATPLTASPGEIPIQLSFGEVGQPQFSGITEFAADPAMVRDALGAAGRCDFNTIASRLPRVVPGNIVSGDQFIKSSDRIHWLRSEFDAYCVEMEGAAMAQVCKRNGVPFVGIRAISDKGHEGSAQDFVRFFRPVCENLAKLVLCYLRTPSRVAG